MVIVALAMIGVGSQTRVTAPNNNYTPAQDVELGLQAAAEARQQLAGYFTLYNTERPHSSLGRRTPDMTYFNQPFQQAA